jgi:hypothetical protein
MATDLYLIRKNQQWVKYTAVEALSVTGAATTDEIEVWSAEYRDIFTPTGLSLTASGVTGSSAPTMTAIKATDIAVSSSGGINPLTIVTGTAVATDSDEIAHEGLRQTKLPRTAWKFDFGASVAPRYAYAFVELGDIIANNPPETA